MNPKTLVSLLALCLSIPAFASEATCRTITDQDRKQHCLALAKDQVSSCLSIKDNDLKSHCQVQVTEDKAYCNGIRDDALKSKCFEMMK